ncbi:MAG: zinc dependent phospholipase C family protein [Clostridiales bacterium]|nr:zinc dependent phospholipase C family protein [Clostridiales bacterium]
MPTTYTHDIFGKDVFKRLPEALKETIRQGKGLYRIGLHGPDIFFYYKPISKNPVNQTGHRMHRELASKFFQKGILEFRTNPSSQLAAYLLGFACHYMLDSTCHGYIGKFEKKTGASHAEIETELDRYFMLREKKELFSYLPTSVLEPTEENCKVIGRVFPQIDYKKIQKSVEYQKMYDKLLTCKSPLKEKIVLGGMKVLRCYDSMEGQVMRKNSGEICRESTEKLVGLYRKALEEAPAALENLYDCLYGRAELSQRFDRDFE